MKKSLLTFAMAAFLCGMQANAQNSFSVNSTKGIWIQQDEDPVNFQLTLENADEVAGFQASISSVDGIFLNEAVIGSRKITNPWIGSHQTTTKYNILCYSQDCDIYEESSKPVAIIPISASSDIELGEYTLSISNGIISDANGKASNCTDSEFIVLIVPSNTTMDINGDDEFDILDVLDYLDAIDEDDIDWLFDFNGDGEIDILDALDLLDFSDERL